MIFFNNIIFANFYDVPVISTSIRNFIPSLQIHLVLKVVKSVPKSFTKSVQLSSVTHSCQNLCNPMDCSTPGFPCPSASPKACSNSCPSHRCCHPTISSSVIPFSSRLQSFPASGSFLMSRLFELGGQSIGASAAASVLPMNIQDWFV